MDFPSTHKTDVSEGAKSRFSPKSEHEIRRTILLDTLNQLEEMINMDSEYIVQSLQSSWKMLLSEIQKIQQESNSTVQLVVGGKSRRLVEILVESLQKRAANNWSL